MLHVSDGYMAMKFLNFGPVDKPYFMKLFYPFEDRKQRGHCRSSIRTIRRIKMLKAKLRR